jgi:hypothetical protein
MKIVNRETFLQLPSNTVFAKYDNFPDEGLCIKGDTLENDFYVQQILEVKCNDEEDYDNVITVAAKNGTIFQLDFHCESRDGLFEPDRRLFVVFEKTDVLMLIERLKECVI